MLPPPCATILRPKVWKNRNVPLRLRSTTRAKSSGV